MAQVRGIRIDENEADKKNGKIVLRKVAVAKDTKRAALGELGNRAVPKNEDGKKESSLTCKPLINLKTIKPRVDTHWKNAAKKIVTRSDSIKTTNGSLLHVDSSAASNKGKVTIRTVKNDKIVNDAQPKIEDQKVAPLRREESNLSRRSLSKLRAVLKDQRKDKVETRIVRKVPECKADSTTGPVVSLLLEVENIDLDDSANPYLLSEYVNDIYDYLYQFEAAFPIKENHLKDQVDVTPKMRSVLIDWINEVHFQFHLAPDTYHMTVGIIDRYLQDVKTTLRKYLQLVGVTALYIAAKVEEMYPPEIKDFIYITDDTYNKEQMHEMERKIVKTLDFQIGRPLSIHFLRRYSKAAKSIPLCHLMSKYFIELVTLDYSLCHYKPSEVAAASLFLTLILINKEKVEISSLWTRTLKHYSKYSAEYLIPLVRKIACLVRDAPSSKFTAVYVKYQSSKFEKVSLRPELKGSKIEQLCAK